MLSQGLKPMQQCMTPWDEIVSAKSLSDEAGVLFNFI